MKRVQICADDFAFDDAISQGILECLDAGRISATSCMVLSPLWSAWAPALRERVGSADFGLHLDLNEFANYAPGRALSAWIAQTYARRLDTQQVQTWVNTQLDAYEAAMQRAPDYVDGHQHVHQLPQIRQAVLAAVVARYGDRCALRFTGNQSWRGGKAAIIAGLGAGALRRAARQQGLRCNSDFAGVYDFGPEAQFAQLAETWLDSLPDGGLMMTHPGRAAATQTRADPIRGARAKERAFWLSTEAGEMLARLSVQLGLCEDWPKA